MTSWITSGLLAGVLWASAAAAAEPIVVGAVVSASGAQAGFAEGYRRALLLWEEQVNAAGGLLGRRVELRLRDDASRALRVAAEYEQLLPEADLLIGPYGSAATLMAAAIAERVGIPMVNGAGPARTVHRRAPKYLFQSAVPYAAYGEGVLEIARGMGLQRLLILARDDPRSRDMAEATSELARKQGFVGAEVVGYRPGNADFSAQIAQARAEAAEAWIAFGEVREAVDMVHSFRRAGYAPALFFARAAAEPLFIELLGQDAEYSLGALAYAPRVATPGNAAFAKAYGAKYAEAPGLAAASGYAAASVLEAAVRRAGTLEPEKLRAALEALELDTVLGPYKVDTTGAQVRIRPALTQIRFGAPTLIWPPALKTADPLPYPQWSERVLLK